MIDTGTDLVFVKITFTDSLLGWALGRYKLLNTTDGGETWNEQLIPSDSTQLRDFYFTDSKTGYIIGGTGLILSTKDGGESWQKQESGTTTHLLRGISFINDSTGWVTGQMDDGTKRGGILLHTDNGGENWEILSDRSDGILYYDVKFRDSLNGIVIGSYGFDNFDPIEVYSTNDGGQNLTHISQFEGAHTFKLKFAGQDTLWASGWGFAKSFDGGETWSSNYSIELTDLIRGLLTFTDVLPVNGKVGWAVVVNILGPENNSYHLYKTSDYGNSWEIVPTPEGFIPHAVTYKGDYLFLAGADGLIITNETNPVKVNDSEELINSFELLQNYPNPFNPSTKIEYNLHKESLVKLTVYDVLGKKIKILVNKTQGQGYYSVNWNGDNEQGQHVQSGIYFIQLTAGNKSITRKAVLIT
jgi:photosystem II stability/assembly factor-like uncharacterized protein